MEFPFGHRRHDDADDEQPPRFPAYPPPGYNPYQDNYGGAAAYPPPPVYPPPVHHVSHESNAPPPPSPFPPYGDASSSPYHPHVQHVRHEYGAPPPPFSGYPPPAQQHVSHETPAAAAAAYPPGGGGYEYGREESQHHQHHHHHHHLHNPFGSSNTVEHVSHDGGELAGRRTVRVFTRAKEDFSLTVRDGKVVLAPANPRDEYQHWIKDLRYNTKVKDQEGFPSFALLNKVTGEAIKHSIGAKYPVRLVRYKPDYLDESVLWTESADTGEGFRCIRMVNNIGLNFDAFHGDADHGGVHDGTTVMLWEWLKGKNQRWKIVPY